MTKVYTITQAVTDTFKSIPFETQFGADEFYNSVLYRLRSYGNPARPLQSSVSRIFRYHKHDYGVVLVNRTKSLWIRKREV